MPQKTVDHIQQELLPYPTSRSALDSLFSCLREFALPVMLTSGEDNSVLGRYDILTAAPEKSLTTKGKVTTVAALNTEETYTSDENPIYVLKREFESSLQALHGETLEGLFPGGAVGYFAYDLLHPWQNIDIQEDDDIKLPSMQVGIYQWALLVDHEQQRCVFTALPGCPMPLVEELLKRFKQVEVPASSSPPSEASFFLNSAFQSNFSQQQYLERFDQVIDYIHAGDCYQVNLAQRFTAGYEGDPFTAFSHLSSLANAPFSAYLEFPGASVLSFSPERFLQTRQCDVLTQPIKGTRPRHEDPVKDERFLQELITSTKDQAENLMIVDLIRNDLGRVCKTGSVNVPHLFEAQSFNNVHHLVSTVAGELEAPSETFDLFAACFPGGSITGAPKIRAMEIISELENRPRSVYCGSVAYFSFSGAMDSNICIRTLVCSDEKIHCWGGGGVVADSNGKEEYQETLDKISLFLSNLPVKG